MPNRVRQAVAAAVVLTLACSLFPQISATAPAPTAAHTAAAPTGAATLTLLPPPAATARPTARLECVPPGAPDPIAAPADFADLQYDIRVYLNTGGPAAGLEQSLRAIGAVTDSGGGVLEVDLTGDRAPEVIVSALDVSAGGVGPIPPGQLFIFTCNSGQYVNVYQSALDAAFPSTAPAIVAAQDVTSDGRADLLYTTSTCGASTCFDTLYVIGWDGASFVNFVSGDTTLAFAKISLKPRADGVVNIEMYGGTQGSVGAGPQRALTNTWAWNGSAIALTGTKLDPPVYRFHVLNDADDAARDGDAQTALALYDRVIHDDSLEEWPPAANERAHLAAYALFRTMLIHLTQGELNGAQSAYDDLKGLYLPGAPGGEFSLVADEFWGQYSKDGSLHEACRVTIAYIEAKPSTLEALNSYGYGNREYTAAEVCPY